VFATRRLLLSHPELALRAAVLRNRDAANADAGQLSHVKAVI
jgi:hypothetical protein